MLLSCSDGFISTYPLMMAIDTPIWIKSDTIWGCQIFPIMLFFSLKNWGYHSCYCIVNLANHYSVAKFMYNGSTSCWSAVNLFIFLSPPLTSWISLQIFFREKTLCNFSAWKFWPSYNNLVSCENCNWLIIVFLLSFRMVICATAMLGDACPQ